MNEFPLVGYVLLFVAIPTGFIFVHLLAGKLVRPLRPHAEKETVYECGEPTIGSAWVQFDVRYYVVALLFVIFDVEVAFFFPWAVVFGQANEIARQEVVSQQDWPAHQENVRRLSPNPKAPIQETGPVREAGESDDKFAERQAASRNRDAKEDSERARTLALVALVDILIFFGVLLLGFAYLWKRGDLAWVRSTVSETAPVPPPPSIPVLPATPPPARELVQPAHH